MKTMLYLMLTASGLGVLCLADQHSNRWSVHEEETIEKTLTLSEAPKRLVIDNLDGYVHVTATTGSQVHIVVHKRIRAEVDADLQQAKSEVKLDITEKPGTVSVYYSAPWRCNGNFGGCNHQERRFYIVTYDIDVETPRDVRPVVSTVNNGDVRIVGTTGDFDVRNVNGGIDMTGIAGSGDVTTVNGPVTVHFTKNPSQPGSFKSVNGELNVFFPRTLSADLRFKTFNGQVYSDFEVTPQAVSDVESGERNGRFVYRSSGLKGARVGQGGAQLTFDTLNGNIRIHRADD